MITTIFKFLSKSPPLSRCTQDHLHHILYGRSLGILSSFSLSQKHADNHHRSYSHYTRSSDPAREVKFIEKALFRSFIKKGYLPHSFLSRLYHLSHSSLNRQSEGSSGSGNNGDKEKDDKDNKDLLASVIRTSALYIISIICFMTALRVIQGDDKEQEANFVSWNEFVHQMLAKGEVKEVIVRPNINMVGILLHDGAIIKDRRLDSSFFRMNITNVAKFEEQLREAERNLGIRPEDGIKVIYNRSFDEGVSSIISTVIGAIVLGLLFRQMSKNVKISSSLFPMSKAKYTMVDPLMPGTGRGVRLSDVAGASEAKQEVMEFVDFLKNPEKYQKLGARVPKGALLLGPPGCGKTLLAKAVATEGNVPFLSMNGSEFIEVIGGLGAARMRDLFKDAKKHAPCIIYIDEIDAIGRTRSASGVSTDGGSMESEQTLNQLLVEMDGILTKEGVLIMSSTNRMDVLDKALLRPGRFDRHIMMGLPTMQDRKEIFELHLKNITLEKEPQVYSQRMASLTLGFTGADIANVVNEAALYAARMARKVVTHTELEYAVERVIGGPEKRSQVLGPEEKRIVAYHESGHALVGWLLEHTDAMLKVTILPRTNQTLGFAQYAPIDKHLHAKEELFEKMCMALGGRVAESVTFNKVTTGAQNDLEKVTKLAYAQVKHFGFSDVVGQLSFPVGDSKDIGKRPYSKKLANTIDSEVSSLIFSAYKKTEEVIRENKDKLKTLAEALLQKETLNYDDVVTLIGPPPFGQKNLIEPLQFEGEMNKWKESGEEAGAKTSG